MQPLLLENRFKRFIEKRSLLTLVCIFCFACLWVWGWLNQASTYGHLHLTFNSPAIGINFETFYHENFVYYNFPEQGLSGKIPFRYLSALKHKYWLYIVMTVFNILFLTVVFTIYKSAKLLKSAFAVPNLRFLIHRILKFFVLILFIAGLFRWGDIQFTPRGHLGRLSPIGSFIYDIFRYFLIDTKHTLVYGFIFEMPLPALKWAAWGSLALLIAAWFHLPESFSRRLDKLMKSMDKISLPRLAATVGIATFILANIISWYKFHHLPILPEAIGEVFQARIFGSGQLSAPITHSQEFFFYPFLEAMDTWHSQFPPGFSLLLTPWAKLNLSWLYNPLLGMLAIFLFYRLSLSAYGNRTAILGLILLGMSGTFIRICGDITPALTEGAAALGLIYFYQRGRTSRQRWDFLYSGLCGGLGILISPKFGLAWLIPVTVHLFSDTDYGWESRIGLFAAGLVPGILILVSYNLHQTDQWFNLSLGPIYTASAGKLWHPRLPGFTFISQQLHEFQWRIWGWLPGLFLLVLWIMLPGEKLLWDKLILGGLLCLVAANMVWCDPYPGLSNIFWAALPFFVLLTARSIQDLPRQLEGIGIPFQPMQDLVILLTVFLLFGSAWRFFYDLTIREAPSNPAFQVTAQLKRDNIAKAVVFMQEEGYLPSFAANLPDLGNPIIFARDLSKSNPKLMQEFPQYKYYSYAPDQGLKEL